MGAPQCVQLQISAVHRGLRADRVTDQGHHRTRYHLGGLIVDDIEVDIQPVLPPEEQQVLDGRLPLTDGDQHIERQPTAYQHLFHIVDVCVALCEHTHQLGGDSGSVPPGDAHENRRIHCGEVTPSVRTQIRLGRLGGAPYDVRR